MGNGNIVVIGGINADITGKAVKDVVRNESNIGRVSITSGGVARNICDNLVRMGAKCEFITSYSEDLFGLMLKKSCMDLGISLTHSYITKDYATGTYLSLEDSSGQLYSAICDSEGIMNMPFDHISEITDLISNCECLVLDCNLSESMINFICSKFYDKKIIVEAVSSAKVIKLRNSLANIYAVKLNRQEFESLYEIQYSETNAHKMSVLYKNKIFVTKGEEGSTAYDQDYIINTDAISAPIIISVNGAGDAYAAGIAYGTMKGYDTILCMRIAGVMSYLTLYSPSSVSENISEHKVMTMLKEVR